MMQDLTPGNFYQQVKNSCAMNHEDIRRFCKPHDRWKHLLAQNMLVHHFWKGVCNLVRM